MPFDYREALSSVTRTVIRGRVRARACTRDGRISPKSDDEAEEEDWFRTIRLARRFDVGKCALWAAVTDPDRLAAWFAPVSGDLVVGGKYHIEGNASGTVRRCNENRGYYELTWEFGGDVSHVRVSLDGSSISGATIITLDHEVPLTEHWTRYGPGAGGVGWDMAIAGLASYIEATDLARDEAWWAEADEAKGFLEGSSAAWRIAAIEAGEDEAWARRAEASNFAYYVPAVRNGRGDGARDA